MKHQTRLVLILIPLLLPAFSLRAQLHKPDEIFKIMEESSISYAIELDEEIEADRVAPEQLPPGFFQRRTDEGRTLETYDLSQEVLRVFQRAETSFADGQFDSAIALYRKVLEMEPLYSGALTMIGDAYYNMRELDSARHYLRKAIELNFADYQAHWFLSSTELQLGNTEEGLRELTAAHVLNPGHTVLTESVKGMRKKLGKAWKEWSFAPRYELTDESLEEVNVRFGPGWMMYAITQALWEYEEGYIEDMGIEDRESFQAMALREKEAALMFIFEYFARQEGAKDEAGGNTDEADTLGKHLSAILEGRMMDPFVYYEILGKTNPILFSMMSPESVYNIVEYIDRYH